MDTRCLRAAVGGLVTLCGCAVGPNYRPPETLMPQTWAGLTTQPAAPSTQPAASQPAVTDRAAELTDWWRTLNDPALDRLIDRAVESNLDLQLATARVRESRALVDVAAADFWPQLGATGAYARRGSSLNTAAKPRTSKPGLLNSLIPTIGVRPGSYNPNTGLIGLPVLSVNGIPLNGGGTAGAPTGTSGSFGGPRTPTASSPRDQNSFQAGFDASWEIDIFGRIRRSVEATQADLAAAEESRRDVLVTLLSEVALNYVQLRGFQRRLSIAEENIRAQEDTLHLTEARYQAGFGSALDVAQARAQLETTRSQVPLLESSIRQSIFQLSVLLGGPPGRLLDELTPTAPIPSSPPEVPIGLPSELLRRRPDIRQAERLLASATARIGVATADLFPTFALTGNFGIQTAEIKHFLDQRSFLWSVGPNVSWPIFQGGRIRANIRAETAREQQALAAYGQTVLVALQDVENALVAYHNERLRYQTLVEAVAASQEATSLSYDLYNSGWKDFLNVLDAERTLYASQDALAASQTTVMTNLIALYKALGGGWQAEGEAGGPPP